MATQHTLETIRRRSVLASGVLLIAIMATATVVVLVLLRNDTLEGAGRHLASLAVIVGEQMHQSVQSVDLIVGATARDFKGGFTGSRRSRSHFELHEDMADRVLALAHVRNLLVFDREGNLRISSQEHPAPALNVGDREYFRVPRDRLPGTLHVGEPVVSRLTGERVQVFSRQLEGEAGEFQGVVVATTRPSYFDRLFMALGLGAEGRVLLFREDGTLLAAYPALENAASRVFADDPLFKDMLPVSRHGVQRRAGLISAEPHIVAFQRLDGYPLVAVVSSSEAFILGPWQRDAWRIGMGAAGAIAFVAAVLFFLMRQLRVSAGLQHDLLETGERLQGIIQSAMDAVITVDDRQRIVLFNAAAERIFRCPAQDAIGGPLDRFIPGRFRAAHHAHIETFGATGATNRRMGLRQSLFGLRADGEEFPIDASISQVAVDGKHFYTVILRDITERLAADVALERSHRELREAGEQLRAIIHSAMDAVVTIDQQHRIVLFNEAAERIFLCKAEEAVGQPLDRFIPERFRAAHGGHIESFGETRVTTRMMGAQLSLFGLRASGEEFPIDASISQVAVEGRKLYTVILRDITQRKAAEEALKRSYEELRELSAAMHEVREAERLRIARELHDELAQWLTALKMDVSWLSSRLPRDQAPLVEKTEKMKALVDTTVASVRRIAADLRPVMLDDLGLVAAMEHLLHDLSERTGMLVGLDVGSDNLDFGEPLSTALYRMTQESLTNVARHAEATEARVGIRIEDEKLVLVVRDNGRGYDETAAGRRSYGIIGIRERAHTLGGTARIERQAAGGTQVTIVIPLARYRSGGMGK